MQIVGGGGDRKGRKERVNQQDFANNRLDDQCIESMRTTMKKKEEVKEPTVSSEAPCSLPALVFQSGFPTLCTCWVTVHV